MQTLFLALSAFGCIRPPEIRVSDPAIATSGPLWEIHFEGNTHFTDAEIRQKLVSEVSNYKAVHTLDADIFQDDLRRIVALYKEHGFFATRVAGVQYFRWHGGQIVVVIRVDEGPRISVRKLVIEGAEASGISRTTALAKKKRFAYADYVSAKETLLGRLKEHGYPYADISGAVEIDQAHLAADVTIRMTPGPRCEIGQIRVVAPPDKPPLSPAVAAVARSLITFKNGETYSEVELTETQNRLYETGVFERVEVAADLSRQSPIVPVEIRLSMGRVRTLKLGFGVGSDSAQQEFRTSASWIHRNFGGAMKTLELRARAAYAFLPTIVEPTTEGVVGEVGVIAGQPSRGKFKLDFSEGLTVDTQLVEAYRSFGAKPEVSVGRRWFRFRRKLTTSLAYKAERRLFSFFTEIPASLAIDVGTADSYTLSYVEPQLVFDTRDDPLDPAMGAFATLTTGHSVGGSYAFDRIVPEIRSYIPLLGPRLVLSGRLRIGAIFARNEAETIHVSQRFFAGGASSHRGFSYRRMSPRITLPDSGEEFLVGGQTLVESSLEIRAIPFRFLLGGTPAGLGAVLFADAGRVGSENAGDFSGPEKLEIALGWGLRFDTIAGPLRFDVGYRVGDLDKNGLGAEPPVTVHFSFGQAF